MRQSKLENQRARAQTRREKQAKGRGARRGGGRETEPGREEQRRREGKEASDRRDGIAETGVAGKRGRGVGHIQSKKKKKMSSGRWNARQGTSEWGRGEEAQAHVKVPASPDVAGHPVLARFVIESQ